MIELHIIFLPHAILIFRFWNQFLHDSLAAYFRENDMKEILIQFCFT